MNDDRRKGVGEDADPLNDMCAACGAPIAQDCAPGCGRAPAPIRARGTDGEPLYTMPDA